MLPEQPAHDDMDEDDNVSSKRLPLSGLGLACGSQRVGVDEPRRKVGPAVLMIDHWL